MSTAAPTKHVLVPIGTALRSALSFASVEFVVAPADCGNIAANGSEEIEAVCMIDTLRRAGASVVVGAVGDSLLVNFCLTCLFFFLFLFFVLARR
jgi:hypothetical protein